MAAGAQMAGAGGKIDHHGFDVAADQIVQRRGGALVGDVGELHAGLAGEALHGQVMRRAHARRGVLDRSRLGPRTLDQIPGARSRPNPA